MPTKVTGNVEYSHVSFSYPTRPGITVLDDFSLHIGVYIYLYISPSPYFACIRAGMNRLKPRTEFVVYIYETGRSQLSQSDLVVTNKYIVIYSVSIHFGVNN